MNKLVQLSIVLLLTIGLVTAAGLTATAAPGEGGAQLQKQQMVEKTHRNEYRHQNRTTTQQDQYLTASEPVVGLQADRDQDRLKDGTGDGDPDRDRVRLQDRIMDCVDQLFDWLRGTGSR